MVSARSKTLHLYQDNSFQHLIAFIRMIYTWGVSGGRVAYTGWSGLNLAGLTHVCPWARCPPLTCPVILRGFEWEMAKIQMSVFMLLHGNKTTRLITSLPLFFLPSKTDREKWVVRMWREQGEQVLFLWLSRKEEVKTFSPLITRETTWRCDVNSACVCMKSLARRTFFIVRCYWIHRCVCLCICG